MVAFSATFSGKRRSFFLCQIASRPVANLLPEALVCTILFPTALHDASQHALAGCKPAPMTTALPLRRLARPALELPRMRRRGYNIASIAPEGNNSVQISLKQFCSPPVEDARPARRRPETKFGTVHLTNARFIAFRRQVSTGLNARIYAPIDVIIHASTMEASMRTTIALDDELIAKAQAYTGLDEKTALVREALKALIQREAARRLANLGGSQPGIQGAPRRRQEVE
jgi:Arc/MetJ family transcription regulator